MRDGLGNFRNSERLNMKKEDLFDVMEHIRQKNGGVLNPPEVVRDAEPVGSVLHECFEWDNALAGYEHRLWQARELIRHCIVEMPDSPNKHIRAYFSLPEDRGKVGYRLTTEVAGDAQLRVKMLAEAKRDMIMFRKKYTILKELVDVVMVAVGELSDAHRLVVTLRYLEGLSAKEIALHLGESRVAIRSRLFKAMQILRRRLASLITTE